MPADSAANVVVETAVDSDGILDSDDRNLEILLLHLLFDLLHEYSLSWCILPAVLNLMDGACGGELNTQYPDNVIIILYVVLHLVN